MNKKAGIVQNGFAIAMLSMFLLSGIFLFIFLDQITADYLIQPLDDISHQINSELNLGQANNDTLNALKQAYDERPISYDIYFMVILAIAVVSTSVSALEAKRTGYFTLFGYIFLFSIFFMGVMFFISQFTDYFITEFMIPLFSDESLDLSFTLHFFNNLNLYTFFWFLWLGFLGFIDIKDFVKRQTDRIEGFTKGGFQR